MLTNALRALVNNPFKENFYRKRKKKVINILTIFFFFSIKVMSKYSQNRLLTNALKAFVSMTFIYLFNS